MQITSIGIDLGKTTFHLVALDERGKIVMAARGDDRGLRQIASPSAVIGSTVRRPSPLRYYMVLLRRFCP
jgi:hypothetical protein